MSQYAKWQNNIKDRPFNMAVAFLERCHFLLIRGNEASVNSEYFEWKKCLLALTRAISFKLDEEKMQQITSDLNTLNANSPSLQSDLHEIETKLIRLMFEYGLYYPKYKSLDWQIEATEEDI